MPRSGSYGIAKCEQFVRTAETKKREHGMTRTP